MDACGEILRQITFCLFLAKHLLKQNPRLANLGFYFLVEFQTRFEVVVNFIHQNNQANFDTAMKRVLVHSV